METAVDARTSGLRLASAGRVALLRRETNAILSVENVTVGVHAYQTYSQRLNRHQEDFQQSSGGIRDVRDPTPRGCISLLQSVRRMRECLSQSMAYLLRKPHQPSAKLLDRDREPIASLALVHISDTPVRYALIQSRLRRNQPDHGPD